LLVSVETQIEPNAMEFIDAETSLDQSMCRYLWVCCCYCGFGV